MSRAVCVQRSNRASWSHHVRRLHVYAECQLLKSGDQSLNLAAVGGGLTGALPGVLACGVTACKDISPVLHGPVQAGTGGLGGFMGDGCGREPPQSIRHWCRDAHSNKQADLGGISGSVICFAGCETDSEL